MLLSVQQNEIKSDSLCAQLSVISALYNEINCGLAKSRILQHVPARMRPLIYIYFRVPMNKPSITISRRFLM